MNESVRNLQESTVVVTMVCKEAQQSGDGCGDKVRWLYENDFTGLGVRACGVLQDKLN